MANTISIGITTYHRPEKLKLLLAALDQQVLPSDLESQIRIVLVDNSTEATARSVAESYGNNGRFPLDYVLEPAKGLSRARNTVLHTALPQSEAIVCIDDDEVPLPNWLGALVQALRESGAAAAVGPVRPIFEGTVPDWIIEGKHFTKELESTGGFVQDGYTCNAIIRTSTIREMDLRFSLAFNQTGGEDTYFFACLQKAGHRIAWAKDAVVLEWTPASRTNFSWLMRRWFRTGGTEAHLSRLDSSGFGGRAFNLARGCLRIGVGTVLLPIVAPLLWHDQERVTRVVTMICRGAGLVASSFGREHQEYAHQSYR